MKRVQLIRNEWILSFCDEQRKMDTKEDGDFKKFA